MLLVLYPPLYPVLFNFRRYPWSSLDCILSQLVRFSDPIKSFPRITEVCLIIPGRSFLSFWRHIPPNYCNKEDMDANKDCILYTVYCLMQVLLKTRNYVIYIIFQIVFSIALYIYMNGVCPLKHL